MPAAVALVPAAVALVPAAVALVPAELALVERVYARALAPACVPVVDVLVLVDLGVEVLHAGATQVIIINLHKNHRNPKV